MTTDAPRIGLIGLGTMGRAMAERLLDEGVPLVVHDVVRESARPLVDRGATLAESTGALARATSCVLLSLPGPKEVSAVVAGEDGLLDQLAPGSVIVDLSTNAVEVVRELAQQAAARGLHFLDSPVSGGSGGARDGTLVLMVGGAAEGLERARPVLEKISRVIHPLGASGAGTITKLINNQLYLCGEVLFFEALVLATKGGLEPRALCEILEQTGAGGVHARLAPRIFERRYEDRTFTLGLAEKDVALALEAGRALEVPMPTTAAAHALFSEALREGRPEANFWSAIEVAERRAGVRIPGDEAEPDG